MKTIKKNFDSTDFLQFFIVMSFGLLFFIGCKEDLSDEPFESLSPVEEIFRSTGCRPTDVEKIRQLDLYVDKDSTKYLYGSKVEDDVESFWVAQYNSSGDQVWEIIHKDTELSSHAYAPKQINNGNIVVGNVIKEGSYPDVYIYGVSPVLITHEGKADYISVYRNYCYNNLYPFDDFFFCDIDPQEVLHLNNPNIKRWCVQFSNDGKIMNQAESMNIPDGKVLWTSDSTYVNMNLSHIARGSLLREPDWTVPVSLPRYESCEMEIGIEGDVVNASYHLSSSGKDTTLTYVLFYATGKSPVKVEGISIQPEEKELIVGEEFILTPVITPEDASMKEVTWKSSDENIATIDESGKVKAINKGECIITATTKDGGFEATCKIKVISKYDVSGVYFQEQNIKIVVGSNYQLNAIVTPATALNKNIKWRSSDDAIVSVDDNGIITGNSIGDAVITAETEEGGYEAECHISVADITDFITSRFTTASFSSVNGYVTGKFNDRLTNNSTVTIHVTGFRVVETNTERVVATADESLLGDLEPGKSFTLGAEITLVYKPMFIWTYEYNGKEYQASLTYDDL